jgi:hypothetical protein
LHIHTHSLNLSVSTVDIGSMKKKAKVAAQRSKAMMEALRDNRRLAAATVLGGSRTKNGVSGVGGAAALARAKAKKRAAATVAAAAGQRGGRSSSGLRIRSSGSGGGGGSGGSGGSSSGSSARAIARDLQKRLVAAQSSAATALAAAAAETEYRLAAANDAARVAADADAAAIADLRCKVDSRAAEGDAKTAVIEQLRVRCATLCDDISCCAWPCSRLCLDIHVQCFFSIIFTTIL